MKNLDDDKKGKINRVLGLYTKFLDGNLINVEEEALKSNVDKRTIMRDICDIRNFLEEDVNEKGYAGTIVYDRKEKCYYMKENSRGKLFNDEILALCKILLDSRAFTKTEMSSLLDRLVSCCTPQGNLKLVKKLVDKEKRYYVELQHRTPFLDIMWKIAQAIHNCQYIEIEYRKIKGKEVVKRKIQPAAIMFSEYYFYLTAFIEDEEVRKGFDVINDSFPTIYRIDRIQKLKILKEKFDIFNGSQFEEGEFRKRIQFMYGGRLQKVKFKYRGANVEAVLDRLPTARILDEDEGVYTISAEVFGKGIDMWLRSQGEMVEVISTR